MAEILGGVTSIHGSPIENDNNGFQYNSNNSMIPTHQSLLK